MKITEIFKIRSYNPSGDLKNYQYKYGNLETGWRKIPGDNPFYRARVIPYSAPAFIIAVKTNAERPLWKIVGGLNVAEMRIDNYYKKNIYAVGAIGVDPKYRGQGVAQHLYDGYLLPRPEGLDGILMAGDSQSSAGRAMWANLKSRPDIEVTGWVKIAKGESFGFNYSDEQMINFFSKVGGAYLGHSHYSWYFEFPVEKLPNKRELEIAVKGSGVKVYGGKSSTGLIARYIG